MGQAQTMRFSCLFLLVASLLGISRQPEQSAAGQTASHDDCEEAFLTNQNLTAEEAGTLEAKLRADPNNTTIRCQLIGYYFNSFMASDDARASHSCYAHILWFIKNRPEHSVSGASASFFLRTDPAAFEQGQRFWEKSLEANPSNTAVIRNAAAFFSDDKARCLTLLQNLTTLEPNNPHWQVDLADRHGYDVLDPLSAEINVESAKRALEAYQRAITLGADDVLMRAAQMAIFTGQHDTAKQYVTTMLDEIKQHDARHPPTDEFVMDNKGDERHEVQIILGQIALANGKIDIAEHHLLQAGRTPGSSSLNSFGPNTLLALRLLESGRSEIVLEYLELCGNFWKDSEREEWIAQIKAGQVPEWWSNLLM